MLCVAELKLFHRIVMLFGEAKTSCTVAHASVIGLV